MDEEQAVVTALRQQAIDALKALLAQIVDEHPGNKTWWTMFGNQVWKREAQEGCIVYMGDNWAAAHVVNALNALQGQEVYINCTLGKPTAWR